MDSLTTTYTLDLNAGLTQVLQDGTYTYLYGNGRIAQENAVSEYFLGDALGSVRQMAGGTGAIVYAASYAPYGEVIAEEGIAQTSYGFTGEMMDMNGLVYLRARFYDPTNGRFFVKDRWTGINVLPMSMNYWLYALAKPTMNTDPSGLWICTPESLRNNPDCGIWIQNALDRLQMSGVIGGSIVNYVHSFDKYDDAANIYMEYYCDLNSTINPFSLGFMRALKFEFVQGGNWYAFATFPHTILLNTKYYNGSYPSGDGITALAHEISHVDQGLRAWSVQAELLTIILEYQLELEMNVPHDWQTQIIDQYAIAQKGLNPWDNKDLLDAQKTFNYPGEPLRPTLGDLPKNWLDRWNTSIPYPINAAVSPIPHPTPQDRIRTSTPTPVH